MKRGTDALAQYHISALRVIAKAAGPRSLPPMTAALFVAKELVRPVIVGGKTLYEITDSGKLTVRELSKG